MKGLKLYLVSGAAILIIYIIAQLNRPKSIDWTESLSNKDKIPFGTYILYNRLHDLYPKAQIAAYREPVYNVLVDDLAKNASYIIICHQLDLPKTDYEKLTGYIRKGNDVFISAEFFGDLAEKYLKVKTAAALQLRNTVSPIHFLSPHLNPKKYYSVDKGTTDVYFSKFDTAKAVVLSENSDHKADLIKFSFGKGCLYLASNPKLFSNYALLKADGAAYAATALAYVKNTPKMMWDEYYTQGDAGEDSPMRVFLSKPYLQWAYYISIYSLLVFVLYEIKRRQRIIPVIEPPANSTIEFVTIIGQLYYEKRNNAHIAQKQISYFLLKLREEYQLKTSELNFDFIEKLTTKLGIDADFAADLVNYIQYVCAQNRVTDRELIKLNQYIENFYIKAR